MSDDNDKISRDSKELDNDVVKQKRESKTDSATTTIIDHIQDRPEHSSHCVVYKFRSRPPYEGFILILVIVLLTALLIWWLNSKFTS
jgi:hypothetical protein